MGRDLSHFIVDSNAPKLTVFKVEWNSVVKQDSSLRKYRGWEYLAAANEDQAMDIMRSRLSLRKGRGQNAGKRWPILHVTNATKLGHVYDYGFIRGLYEERDLSPS